MQCASEKLKGFLQETTNKLHTEVHSVKLCWNNVNIIQMTEKHFNTFLTSNSANVL